MISAWGIEHGEISKAAWKAFYPVPPKVAKIPRAKLKFTTKTQRDGSLVHRAQTLRGKNAGLLATSRRVGDSVDEVDMAAVHPGFRRRGIASNLMAHGEKSTGVRIEHSATRTPNGNAFAQAHDKRRGSIPTPLSSTMQGTKRGKKGKETLWTVRQGKSKTIAYGSQIGRTGIERGKKRITPPSERRWD